jgi:DNA end-binding protein Ku
MATTLWKGRLTFGLVSIPVKLFRAARAEKVRMHHLQRQSGARVRQVFVPAEETCKAEAAPATSARPAAVEEPGSAEPRGIPKQGIPKQDLVRGFEYAKDKYVEFEPAELEQIAPQNSSTMEIIEFVKFAEVDPVYLEDSYYVAADKGGEKPYGLLFEALRKTGYSAITEFVMYRRDHTIILRPGRHGIIAHTLFYQDEVKRENEFHANSELATPGEMNLAVKLIEALATRFEPEKFTDKYRQKLQTAIAEKIETGAFKEAPASSYSAAVVDIMTALKQSLNQARKPAASEVRGTAANAAGKKTRAR